MKGLKRNLPIAYVLAIVELILALIVWERGSITTEYMHLHGFPREIIAVMLALSAVALLAWPERDVPFVLASMAYIWFALQTLFVAMNTHTGFAGPVFAIFSIVQMYMIFGEQHRRCDDD
jgi:hypothetical protein